MRSALLDECFDEEEREFLQELMEPALHDARETMAQHEIDAGQCESAEDLAVVMASKERQRKRIKFFEILFECLEGGDND